MRPNIAVMGFYNLDDLRNSQPLIEISEPPKSSSIAETPKKSPRYKRQNSKEKKMQGVLPTDLRSTLQAADQRCSGERIPRSRMPDTENTKKYIDLWPIQMSAEIAAEGDRKQNVLTTNFDTYTLILQLGVILNTVPAWKKAYKLRVAVFVEYENDVEEERGRVKSLLENLRIEAEILVFWLASGEVPSYEIIVNGATLGDHQVDEVEKCLKGQDWWDEIQKLRGNRGAATSASVDLAQIANVFQAAPTWPGASFQQGPRYERAERFLGLRRLLKKSKKRHNMSNLRGLRVNMESDSELETEESESDDESAASEADLDEFESDSESHADEIRPIARRRSHGDSLRGPPISKRAAGEKEPVPPTISRPTRQSIIDSFNKPPDVLLPTTSAPVSPPHSPQIPSTQPSPIPNFTDSMQSLKDSPNSFAAPTTAVPKSSASSTLPQPRSRASKPPISRHASTPKFSSKPRSHNPRGH
ncbi:hypothetical protein EYC84_004393 [Monilinia fructicola]|uniref:Uncharacterized protein n=1 Tax=Monilinia fructicola TaxID=38448 RepID=A0A5M9K4V6_MONFR|nr:hypothetical protein EYC84_004393 [Monilinia fructicola]